MTVEQANDSEALASGLRALEVLARHAPIDIDNFARISGVSLDMAHALVAAFEQCGYVVRLMPGNVYILSALALPIVGRNAAMTRDVPDRLCRLASRRTSPFGSARLH